VKPILILILAGLTAFSPADKQRVTFQASDGLTITADKYEVNEEYPYILLFHMSGSSRGEYMETAEKFNKLNYNCLAVDLRSGKNSNYINNETARQAERTNKSQRLIDTRMDIQAAITYALNLNPKPVILFGSSFSASLCLVEGQSNPNVAAVIAFSPGEYFGDDMRVQDELGSFEKPLFVTATQREEPYTRELLTNVNPEYLTFFTPENSPGLHGSKALWESSQAKDEYWLALIMFFNSLQ
jgi:pimeloyl-ACP methyl ester carboxylesterase